MILNWEQKIITTCQQLGIDPEVFTDDADLREWMAKHFGFKDYDSFLALAIPKDIVAGMALSMLPDHKNYEYHLARDCVELIQHNYDLYADTIRTEIEVERLLQFVNENFSTEVQAASLKLIMETLTDSIVKMTSRLPIYKTLIDESDMLGKIFA